MERETERQRERERERSKADRLKTHMDTQRERERERGGGGGGGGGGTNPLTISDLHTPAICIKARMMNAIVPVYKIFEHISVRFEFVLTS